MTSHNQLQADQQEIDSVKAEIQQTKQDLAKAKADNDSKEVDFLRKRLEQLDKKENILLRAQAPGRHCLPRHHLAGLPVLYQLFVCHVGPTPC